MHMDFADFPVDRHQLVLVLRSRKQAHLVHLTDAGLVSRWHSLVSTSGFAQHAEWKISPHVFMHETESHPNESSMGLVYPEIHLAMRCARRPGVYVWDVGAGLASVQHADRGQSTDD